MIQKCQSIMKLYTFSFRLIHITLSHHIDCNSKNKNRRQVNKKFCELKVGNIGIDEKAQETRSGTSHKHSKYDIVMVSQKSCFVSYIYM